MAKATLEIVVSDKGGSVTGGGGVGATAPAGAGQTVTAPASVRTPRTPTTTVTGAADTATKAAGAAETVAEKAALIQQVAGNSGALGAGAASAAGTVGSIARLGAVAGPVGIAIAAVGTAASAGVVGFKKFTDAMHEQAQKLSSVSSAVAVAVSQSELRAQLAEIRRGRIVGPQLAEFEQARSRLTTKIYDLVSRVEGPLLETAVPVLEALAALVPYLEPLIKLTFLIVKNTGDFNVLKLLLEAIRKYLGDDKEKEIEMDPAVQKILDLVDRDGDGIVDLPRPAVGGI